MSLVLTPVALPFANGTTSSCFRKASMRSQDIKYSNLPLGVSLALSEIIFMLVIAGLVKLTASQISIMTALAARYLFCLPLLLMVGFWLYGIGTLRPSRPRPLAIRILAGLLGLSFYFAALEYISLAKVTAIGQTSTLFVTLLAPFLLAEKIGWRRWTACLIGFAGTVILIEPGASEWNPLGVGYAVLATIFGSLVLIMLRRIGQHESPVTSAIWYNGVGAIIFVSYQLIFDLPLPHASGDRLILVVLGLVASLQQIALAASHRFAPASMLASLRYLSIPLGMGAGMIFFGELITAQFVGGSAIVIAASIFIVYRERAIGSRGTASVQSGK